MRRIHHRGHEGHRGRKEEKKEGKDSRRRRRHSEDERRIELKRGGCRDPSTASRKGAALRSGGQGITGGGIRCQIAAEREVAEEKQIPRFARDDKDGKRQEREIAPT